MHGAAGRGRERDKVYAAPSGEVSVTLGACSTIPMSTSRPAAGPFRAIVISSIGHLHRDARRHFDNFFFRSGSPAARPCASKQPRGTSPREQSGLVSWPSVAGVAGRSRHSIHSNSTRLFFRKKGAPRARRVARGAPRTRPDVSRIPASQHAAPGPRSAARSNAPTAPAGSAWGTGKCFASLAASDAPLLWLAQSRSRRRSRCRRAGGAFAHATENRWCSILPPRS